MQRAQSILVRGPVVALLLATIVLAIGPPAAAVVCTKYGTPSTECSADRLITCPSSGICHGPNGNACMYASDSRVATNGGGDFRKCQMIDGGGPTDMCKQGNVIGCVFDLFSSMNMTCTGIFMGPDRSFCYCECSG